jgi:hypothetical protein
MPGADKPSETPSSSSGRWAPFLVVAGVVVAACIAFALWPRTSHPDAASGSAVSSSEEPVPSVVLLERGAPSAARSAPMVLTPPEARAEAPKAAPLPPIDLFAAAAPELLQKTHEVTMRGEMLPVDRMKELYQLGKDHPGDARPHLVMAEDAMNRGWNAFAVDHYTRAQREDPRARQDPRMLKDLVSIAGGKHDASKASDAIISIYGQAAISAVEDAIAAAGDRGDQDGVQRLAALSGTLAGPPR